LKALAIKCGYGVNDIVFGMSPEDVDECMGAADNHTTATSIGCEEERTKRKEARSKVNYIYENDKLICISGELFAPFTLDGEKVPFTAFEVIKFLKRKSKLSMRLSNIMSYIFADLGIVLYPYTVIDIEAGIKSTVTSQRIAICNNEVLKRYTQYFFQTQENKEATEDDFNLIERIGLYLEEKMAKEDDL